MGNTFSKLASDLAKNAPKVREDIHTNKPILDPENAPSTNHLTPNTKETTVLTSTTDPSVIDDQPKTVNPDKPVKQKPLCKCGCGLKTGGGEFLPGHDAKLKSKLFRIVRGEEAGDVEQAMATLTERNWLWLMSKKVGTVKSAPVAKPKVTIAKMKWEKGGKVLVTFTDETTVTLEPGMAISVA